MHVDRWCEHHFWLCSVYAALWEFEPLREAHSHHLCCLRNSEFSWRAFISAKRPYSLRSMSALWLMCYDDTTTRQWWYHSICQWFRWYLRSYVYIHMFWRCFWWMNMVWTWFWAFACYFNHVQSTVTHLTINVTILFLFNTKQWHFQMMMMVVLTLFIVHRCLYCWIESVYYHHLLVTVCGLNMPESKAFPSSKTLRVLRITSICLYVSHSYVFQCFEVTAFSIQKIQYISSSFVNESDPHLCHSIILSSSW
jgi:hypothetical protein